MEEKRDEGRNGREGIMEERVDGGEGGVRKEKSRLE